MPEESPVTPASLLTDKQLQELLVDLRTNAAPDAPETIQAIAALEAEAASRKIDLGKAPHEEMPQQFLLRRFEAAVKGGHVHRVQMSTWDMEPPTVWKAYRIIREVESAPLRRCILGILYYVLDCRAFGTEVAGKHKAFIRSLQMNDDEEEDFIHLCIKSTFGTILYLTGRQ